MLGAVGFSMSLPNFGLHRKFLALEVFVVPREGKGQNTRSLGHFERPDANVHATFHSYITILNQSTVMIHGHPT